MRKNYFTDIDENNSLEDIIKRYETADFSNCEIKNKIEFEYDLLKIFDKQSYNFITININQIYNIIYKNPSIKLSLDNDTLITIEVKR